MMLMTMMLMMMMMMMLLLLMMRMMMMMMMMMMMNSPNPSCPFVSRTIVRKKRHSTHYALFITRYMFRSFTLPPSHSVDHP